MFFFFQDNSKYRKKYRRPIKFKELVSRPVSKKICRRGWDKGRQVLGEREVSPPSTLWTSFTTWFHFTAGAYARHVWPGKSIHLYPSIDPANPLICDPCALYRQLSRVLFDTCSTHACIFTHPSSSILLLSRLTDVIICITLIYTKYIYIYFCIYCSLLVKGNVYFHKHFSFSWYLSRVLI